MQIFYYCHTMSPMTARHKTYVLRRADQLAALASPVRWRIAEFLATHGPSSVRDLAGRLGRKPEALYYHVRAMAAVGLVLHDSDRRANRRTEAVYKLVAPRLTIDRKQRSSAYKEALCRSCETLLRLAGRDHRAAVFRGDFALEGPDRSLLVRRCSARLTRRGLAEVNRLLDRVVELLGEQDDTDSSDAYAVTIAFSRTPSDTRRPAHE